MLLQRTKQMPCQVAGGPEFEGLEQGGVLPAAHWMHPMEAGLRCFGAGGARFNKVRRSGYMPMFTLSGGR